jgi:DNA anti-recombination protein RmuC
MTTGSPVDEMLARREIKAAEKERRENIERAREAAQLGAEIQTAFTKNQTLGRTELKKLERLEKLTRRIREEAGGSSGDVTIENPPRELKSALEKLVELSEAMNKGVEKTPRQVISAFVIERTNEVLEIIRYVRSYLR